MLWHSDCPYWSFSFVLSFCHRVKAFLNKTDLPLYFRRGGELILMDAGSEYHGYASDITRTWPVSGKFSEPQRELYELVLRVHKKCLQVSDISFCFLILPG